jgi:hypothetical protein
MLKLPARADIRRHGRRGASGVARTGAQEGAEVLADGVGGFVAAGINGLIGANAAYSSRQHANALSAQHQAIYGYPAEAYNGDTINSVKVAVAYVVMKKNRKVGHRSVDASLRTGGGIAGAVIGNVPGLLIGVGVGRVPTYLYKTMKYSWKKINGTRGVHRGEAAAVLWNKMLEGREIDHALKDDDDHMALFACEEILGSEYFDLAIRGHCSGDREIGVALLKQKLKSW